MVLTVTIAFLIGMAGGMMLDRREIAKSKGEMATGRPGLAGADANGKRPAPTLAEVLQGNGRSLLDSTGDLLRFAQTIEPEKIGGVIDTLNKRHQGTADALLRNLLMARWAETDPAGALAWIRTKDVANRSNDSADFYLAWGTVDPVAAIAGLKQIPDLWKKAQAEAGIFGQLAETDPQKALSLLQQLPANQQSIATQRAIFGSWAGVDPLAAAAAVMKLPRGFNQTTAVDGVAEFWANQDPQAALAWIDQLPPGYGKESAKLNAMTSIATQDPALAATYIDTPGMGNRTVLIGEVSENWAQTDPQAALAWVGNVSTGQVYNKAMLGILGQMGQADPQGTAAYIAQLPDASMRDDADKQLAGTWAQSDFDGALAWAQGLPASDGDTRSAALGSVMHNWILSDPAGAGDYLMQNMQNDPGFGRLAYWLSMYWSSADAPAALAWVQTLPPGETQNNAMDNVLQGLGGDDPQTAWNVATQIADPKGRSSAMASVITGLSNQNPAQAAAMYAQMPDGEQKDYASGVLAGVWVAQNPQAAGQWIGTLPSGEARDVAVATLVTATDGNDPSGAFAWAASIGDPAAQQKQLTNVIGQWAKTDPAAATLAVQAANLTDQQRIELLQTVQQTAVAAKSAK